MTVQATAAAQVLADRANEISSHELISLLMQGGLERSAQARACLEAGDRDKAYVLIKRLVGIINGLQKTLNFERGGDIATNLDVLYKYMLEKIEPQNGAVEVNAMCEVSELLTEVKVGWDEMELADS